MRADNVSYQTAKGNFYQAALAGGDTSKALVALGGIPALDASQGNGSNLLPVTLTNELILEPLVENPMRDIVRVSAITGLEEPSLMFGLDGAFDSITDEQTAQEVELTGGIITYGRNKVKPMAKVSDTLIYGNAALHLASEIDNALRSGLALNEINRMFATEPADEYAHMSFYAADNNITVVTGSSIQTAIGTALADLPLAFRRNASIVMNAVDWFNMWKDNLNNSMTFFGQAPMTLYDKPVILVDDAERPIVGDFNYCRINYDINTIFDIDKDVNSGIYSFVLTAWYDIRVRLASAFRIAEIAE